MPFSKHKRKLYDLARSETRRRGRPPSDHNEKKLLLQCRLRASLLGRLHRLVNEGIANGTYPWKTMTACVEGLLLRGLETLKGDEMVDEMLPYLRAISEVDSISNHRREAQGAFARVKMEIAELLAIRAETEAVQYYHATYANFSMITETVWREWLLNQMRRAFPALHKQKPKGIKMMAAHTHTPTAKRGSK